MYRLLFLSLILLHIYYNYIERRALFQLCVFYLQLHYNHALVTELKQLYLEIAPEEEREGRVWDLSVEDLRDVGHSPVTDHYKEIFTFWSNLSFHHNQFSALFSH